jgi:hypothetical protein
MLCELLEKYHSKSVITIDLYVTQFARHKLLTAVRLLKRSNKVYDHVDWTLAFGSIPYDAFYLAVCWSSTQITLTVGTTCILT